MTAMRLLPRFLVVIAALLPLAAQPARAGGYQYSFLITNFTDAATLTVSFNGADSNNDGIITGLYGAPSGTPDPLVTQEVTALSLSFSGNSVFLPFNVSTSDFTSTSASLVIPSVDPYVFEMIYVLDSAGTWTDVPDGPPGAANGDGILILQGLAGDNQILVFGVNCGGFGGIGIFGPGTCAGLQYGNADTGAVDYALFDVPEPASLALLAAGLGLLTLRRRA